MDIDHTNIRRLDPTLLLIFRELVRHRRTTVAAQRLRLSQSAVSHALGRLRDLFGDPLFLRLPHGLEPTRYALELAPKIESLLERAGDLVGARLPFEPDRADRVFRLAGNDLVCDALAGPLIAELGERAPHARLTVRFAVGNEAFKALRDDEIDLALGRIRSLPEGFVAEPLFEETFAVVAARHHPLLSDGMSLDRYLACDHVLVSFVGGLHGMVDTALRRQGRSRRVVASVPMFLSAFGVVAASRLIATVPATLAAKYATAFGLDEFTPPLPIDPFSVLAIRHARSRRDSGLDWLIGRLRHLAEHGAPSY
jgi:DNA-binding transcriptional LysR family regulator